MDITQIAQTLLDDMQKDLSQAEEQEKLLQGAMKGVQVLHQRLLEAQEAEAAASEQDSQPASGKKAKSGK